MACVSMQLLIQGSEIVQSWKQIFLSFSLQKMEVPDETTLSTSYVFRGIEYIITMIIQGGNSLTVEVEDRLTADQWRAQFDSACNFRIFLLDVFFLYLQTCKSHSLARRLTAVKVYFTTTIKHLDSRGVQYFHTFKFSYTPSPPLFKSLLVFLSLNFTNSTTQI